MTFKLPHFTTSHPYGLPNFRELPEGTLEVCFGHHLPAGHSEKNCEWVRFIREDKKHFLNARFHIEGGKLVKTSNGQPVPPEEPTFILRGRDLLAMPTLATYYKLGEQDGCNEEFLAGIREAMNGFARFEFEQRAKMKQPGITRGL